MTTRRVAVAAAAALSLLAAGCGNEACNQETPPVKTSTLSDCPAMAAGAPVTVRIPVCPTCNQGTPTCTYRGENLGQGYIQLEPLAEACESSNSCPPVNPSSCPASPVSCQFTAPNTPGTTYTITVVTAEGGTIDRAFPIASSGGETTCTL